MKAQEWLQAKRSFFPDAQGQLTQQSLVEPGRNLPASMKKIQSKMKAQEY